LEAYASASAVAAITTEGLKAGAASSLQTLYKAGEKISARRVYEAAEGGDTFSLEIIDATATYLAIGITTMVHIVDPGLVVLGGAMDFGGHASPVGMRFLNRIRSEFKELTFANVAEGTTIDFATLGGDAGYLGAAGIARDDYLKLGQR
jgi:glucokinase